MIQKILIDKETISTFPLVHFNGKIHVVDSVPQIRKALDFLQKQPLVGFDTETRPSFKKGEHHKVALLQISTDSECFLFRVNKTGMSQDLLQYLSSEENLKVGLSLHDDFNAMRRRAMFEPGGFIDLQDIVADYLIGEMSLQKIFAILFEEKISKGQRITNWEAQPLTPAQMQYAAIDAWACLRIYKYLKSGEFDPQTSKYLQLIPEEETQPEEQSL